MFNELRKIGVFVKRDFRMLFTYKLAFLMSFLSIIFNLLYMVLFGSMFGSSSLPALSQYGGDFISYIIIGSMGWGFLWSILNTTAFSLRTEMMMGTLESILLTPTKMYTMMIAYTLFGCFFGLVSLVIVLLIGLFAFGVDAFATANVFTLIIFILSLLMMMGFGMIFSGLTIWVKNIGETIPLFQGIALFFCGVYFPISVLPSYLQPVSRFISFYYSIEGLRQSLMVSNLTSELLGYMLILLILAVGFIAIGLFVLHKGLIKAKKDGSLAFY